MPASSKTTHLKSSKHKRYYQQWVFFALFQCFHFLSVPLLSRHREHRLEQSRQYQQEKRDRDKFCKAHGIPNETSSPPRKQRTVHTNGGFSEPCHVDEGVQVDTLSPTLTAYQRLTDLRVRFDEWGDGGVDRWQDYQIVYPPLQNHLRHGAHLAMECHQLSGQSLPDNRLDIVMFYRTIVYMTYSIGRLCAQIFLDCSPEGMRCTITQPDFITQPDYTPAFSIFDVERLDCHAKDFYAKKFLPLRDKSQQFISKSCRVGMDPGPRPRTIGEEKLRARITSGHNMFRQWLFLLEKAGNVFTDEEFTRIIFREALRSVYPLGEVVSRLEAAIITFL